MSRRSIAEDDPEYAYPSGQIHTCAICGTQGIWKRPWQWYGSWSDWDDGKPILKFCSDACGAMREEYEQTQRIAANLEATKTDEQRLEEELARKRRCRERVETELAARTAKLPPPSEG